MVAYSFKARFADAVETRRKRQTIRAEWKSRHARPGEYLQLYTGMRTKHCRKLVDPDPVCLSVQPVVMNTWGVRIDGEPVGELGGFAAADGFADWPEMRDWFAETHGFPFTGWLISW
jgi:hypothetical protein